MNKEKLETLASMTNNNAHGLARIYIAKHFEYLKKYENILQNINNIHEIEGSMPILLSEYRENITKQMLHEIEKHEGFEIKNEIMGHL